MGRARPANTRRTAGRRRIVLRRLLAAAGVFLIAFGCKQITGDLDRVIVLEIGNFERAVEVGDTITFTARALTASGAEAPDAAIVWAVLDVDSGPTVLEVDPGGIAVGGFPGMQRVQARLDELRSDPIGITVTAPPDSIAAVTERRTTVAPGENASGNLSVTLFENITEPGQPTPLPGKIITFRVVDPAPGGAESQGVELVTADTVATDDPQHALVLTGADGGATAIVRLTAVRPDSVSIDATATTALGEAVTGSPIRFTVVFEPNP
jgi:hypothetical protein